MSLSRLMLLMAAAGFTTSCGAIDPDEFSSIYLVKLNVDPEQVVDQVNDLSDEYGFQPIHVYDAVSEGFSVRLLNNSDLLETLRSLTVVDSISKDKKKDRLPPNEPKNDEITLGDDEVPAGLTRIGAPYLQQINWSDAGITVAVVDTGIDSNHSDLNWVDEFDPVCDSRNDCADGSDPQGHGTHVAGTIGALADGEGVVGVAPGVPLVAVRVLGSDGSGYMTDILAGLEYIADNPDIRVANMSLGGPAGSSFDAELSDALERLERNGVVVSIAAGNEEQDTANVVPAGLDKGIVVSAYNVSNGSDNGFAWFSNYGDAVDIAAPGVGILSTYPGGGYQALDGTSMAAPHVAGAAAVYMALHPNADAGEVRAAIVNSGEDGYTDQGGRHPEPLLDFAALID